MPILTDNFRPECSYESENMASWNPFGQSYSIFPHQTASNDDDGVSWKIELPGGGFIQKPGSELNPFTDEPQMANEDFESPEEREALMAELDELLEEREAKDKTLRELQDKEVTLRRDLNDLNRELDLQSTELHILMETVCAKRTEMEKRVREKQKRVEELREEFSVVVRDERRNASYRIIANESRYLKRRISQQKEVRNSLRKQVDEIRDHKKIVKIRCKMMVSEERALWMSISERVKRMAENGHPLDVGHTMAGSTSTRDEKSDEGSSSNTSNLEVANKEDTIGDASTGDETETPSNTSSQSAATCVEITKPEARSCSEIKTEISPTKAEQSAQTSYSPSARDQTNPKGSVKGELDDTKLRGKHDYKEGLLYRESLRMDLPGGPWTESCSTTSASSSESEDGGKQITVKVDVHRPFKKRKITFGFLKQLPLQRQQTTAEGEEIEVAPVEETNRTCNVKESRQKGGFFGRLWRRLKKSSNMK